MSVIEWKDDSETLDSEAWRLLDLINAEWESDPLSVQCFDQRIIEQTQAALKRHRELTRYRNPNP